MGRPAKKLTHRQNQLVDALQDPKNHSVSAAARAVGMVPQSGHTMLKRVQVADELEVRRGRQSDKARGELATIQRLRAKLEKQLDGASFEGMGPQDAIQAYGSALKLKELELSIRAQYPDTADLEEGLKARAAYRDQALRVGKYMQRRADRG